MLLVGLTGGIGAGKSTFAALLAERGAQIIDADQLGRDALRPDEPAWHSVVSQFGEEVLLPGSMEIDRKRLASIVFNNSNRLAALNAIVHPVILHGIADHIDRLRATDEVVVLDAALILELGLDDNLDVMVAVVSERSLRTERLTRDRSMTVGDADARMASQLDPAEVVRRSDIVVRNDGSLEDLSKEADRVWRQLAARNDEEMQS
ncbi:MAG: dephospho-CoA kinase [Actinomycetota bacterium]